jgi:hypothetical protein
VIKVIKVIFGNWGGVSGFGRAVVVCSAPGTHPPATQIPQLPDPTGIAKLERRNEGWMVSSVVVDQSESKRSK